MNASEVVTIGATVMVLTQIVKRAVPHDGYSIYIAGGVSLLAVLIWVVSGINFPPARTDLWAIFSGWVSVFATAAGLHSAANVATSELAKRRERIRKVREAGELREAA